MYFSENAQEPFNKNKVDHHLGACVSMVSGFLPHRSRGGRFDFANFACLLLLEIQRNVHGEKQIIPHPLFTYLYLKCASLNCMKHITPKMLFAIFILKMFSAKRAPKIFAFYSTRRIQPRFSFFHTAYSSVFAVFVVLH